MSTAEYNSELGESYRLLRTHLFSLNDGRTRTIMITSALPREGKSTVAANLAMACANGHKRVLLVDSDFRRPTQHVRFGIENNVGLAQALRNDRPEILVHHAQPGLDVLTSGPLPANPPDRLASDTMARLVEFVKSKYDMVILDSPPVLPATDAVILASRVDGVLLVIKASYTRREQAAEAVRQLKGASAKLLGVVLNSVSKKRSAGGGGKQDSRVA